MILTKTEFIIFFNDPVLAPRFRFLLNQSERGHMNKYRFGLDIKTRLRHRITLKEVRMATKRKQQKLREEPTLFVQPDVILEVEGKQLHVRKQVLAENSPVFRRMFESDFKERRGVRIPLPGKKYEDFEMFLRTFYNPAIVCPITSK